MKWLYKNLVVEDDVQTIIKFKYMKTKWNINNFLFQINKLNMIKKSYKDSYSLK
jgi:hypothetical protein